MRRGRSRGRPFDFAFDSLASALALACYAPARIYRDKDVDLRWLKGKKPRPSSVQGLRPWVGRRSST
jgi:hypothetical protein